MRGSRLSICLSLSILVLLVAAGWLLHRTARERPAGGRAGGAFAPPSGERPSSDLPGADPGDAVNEPPAEPAKAESNGAADGPAAVSIEGKVTDATGNGVAGARVAVVERRAVTEAIARDEKLLEHAPLEALRAFQRSLGDLVKRLPSSLTDAGGNYALRGLPGGDHGVVVTHADFLPHWEEDWLPVEPGRKIRYDVELRGGDVISGFARDGAGSPIPGARVQATPVETARLKGFGKLVQIFIEQSKGAVFRESSPVMTDDLGAFRVAPLEPGAYDLRLVKDGFAWGEARDVASGTADVLIELQPALRVSGRVLSPAMEPVTGAAVVLREPEHDLEGPGGPLGLAFVDVDLFGERERGAATDGTGRFVLQAFARGAYDLVIRAEGFPERRRHVALGGGALDLGDLVLAESREIAGLVLSPDGAPVEGADVWIPRPAARRGDRDGRRLFVLQTGPSWSVATTRTDRRGAFRLNCIDGDREVAVLAEGYPGQLQESVAAGERSVTIVLERGLAVRGRAVDEESGQALPGVRVGVLGNTAREETTDGDGGFELRGVGLGAGRTFGGSIVVRASLEGFREARETVAVPDPPASPSVDVSLTLRHLRPEEMEGAISGVVRDARGEPIAGALVRTEVPGWPSILRGMEVPGSVPKEARTDAAGAFTVRAPQIGGTTFEVLASYPGLATSRAGPFPQNREEEDWPLVEMRLGEGVAVEGRITSLDGAPISGARLRFLRDMQLPREETLFTRLLPQAEGEVTHTAKDGTYRLRRIEPGTYQVEARARGHASKTLGPLEIQDTGAPARIDVALDPGGTFAGRVVDSAGDPLPGVDVLVFPAAAGSSPSPEDNDELIEAGALGSGGAVTGRDGDYRIEHLPAGDFRVLARARGYEAAWISSSVPNEQLPDLVLAPHARIAGTVREAETGAPLKRFTVHLDRGDGKGSFSEDAVKTQDVADAGGRFVCVGLRAGEWRVRITAGAHVDWDRVLSLEPGAGLELEVDLTTGRRIDGAVQRPDGAPIAGATVIVRREGEGDLETVHSGKLGEFVFSGLADGPYEVIASHPEHYAEAAAAVKVEVPEDATVRLELRLAGKIHGRVRGLVFEPPAADIFIVVFSPVAGTTGPSFQVWADEKGKILMDSVRPGKYRLLLTHRQCAPQTDEWITVPPENQPLGEVEVRAGEMATFDLDAR